MEGSTEGAEKGATKELDGEEYTIRPFESGDEESFLSLYESVAGENESREWFEWKYGSDNPFYDEIPIIVTERDGELVGAKPHVPVRLRVGETTALALNGADTMVHEDHRRRGLFSRMTAATMERYADREPVLTMNLPNQNSQSGYRKQGWYFPGVEKTTAYRIHDAEYYARQLAGVAGELLGPVAKAILEGTYSRLSDAPEDGRTTIEVNPSDPAVELGAVPRRNGDGKFHFERDETFYRWWLYGPKGNLSDDAHGDRNDDEDGDRTVYVARRNGDPVAGAVVTTHRTPNKIFTEIEDVVPVSDPTESAVSRVMNRLLTDARDAGAALVGVPTDSLSADHRRAFGFVDQTDVHRAFDRVGLANVLPSHVTRSPHQVALRPFGDQFTVDGVTVTDPENWLVPGFEYF